MFEIMSRKYNNVEYDKIEYDKIERYIPPIKKGRVIKVNDGDTITVASKLPNFYFWSKSPIYRFNIRLNGINCPEIKSKNKKQFSLKVKKILTKMILNKDVMLEIIGQDKHGKLIADVYYKDLNISNFLLENKMGLLYNLDKSHIVNQLHNHITP